MRVIDCRSPHTSLMASYFLARFFMARFWQTTRFKLDLSLPRVMGIVNVTPDSFSDGGRFAEPGAALAHCERLLHDGADILDIGAESSRPGAPPLPLDQELMRLLPVLRGALSLGVPVSVDTSKPEVMQAVLDLGADIINDIRALRHRGDAGQPDAAEVVARHPSCGVCLMHMHGEPQTMQLKPMGHGLPGPADQGVTAQVLLFLKQRSDSLLALGVQKSRIVWDMGIGFGKTVEQNFQLLAEQGRLLEDGYPLLAGWSRKSALGAVTGLAIGERLVPSLAAALLAVERGARIVRVHDVVETVAALRVWQAAVIQPMQGEAA